MKTLHRFLAGITASILSIASVSAGEITTSVQFDLIGTAGPGLRSGSEAPPVMGGTGGEVGPGIFFDTQTKFLTVNVAWGTSSGFTNLTTPVTGAHIHGPTANVNGNGFTEAAGIAFHLNINSADPASGTIQNNVFPLNPAQEAALFQGKFYINVHTQVNGGGEIRGFLVPPAPPNSAPTVTLIGANPLNIELGTPTFTDPGATAMDIDNNLASNTITSNTVNTSLRGNYSVTYTATDTLGATGTATRTVNVVDTTPPVITAPASFTVEASGPTGAVATFGASATDLGFLDVFTVTPASGTTFPIGTAAVTVYAEDDAGNNATTQFNITVADTTPPTIEGTFSPTTFTSSVPLPDYTGQAMTSDLVGVTTVTQSPEAGSIFLEPGQYTVTLTAFDAAGNSASTNFDVFIQPGATSDPVLSVIAGKNTAILGAGLTGTGIPAGATWATPGIPSINSEGQVAFKATYKALGKTHGGIFKGTPTTADTLAHNPSSIPLTYTYHLIATIRDATPDITDAFFSTIKDPLLASDGSIAWGSGLSDTPSNSNIVTPADNTAIFLDADGEGTGPAITIAREGDTLPGGATFKAFTSVALSPSALAFTATLHNKSNGVSPGPGGVTGLSDTGLWVHERATGTTRQALREGDTFDGSTIKTIAALIPRSGTAGQGRGLEDCCPGQTHIPARITLADKRHAILGITELGEVFPYYTTGDFAQINKDLQIWATFGIPTQNTEAALAFLAKTKAFTPTASVLTDTAIFAEDENDFFLERIIGKGDNAGIPGATFAALKDPASALGGNIAFQGTMKTSPTAGITSTTNEGIWHTSPFTGLELIAREGDQPPGAPAGAQWKTFTSLALADTGITGSPGLDSSPAEKGGPLAADPGFRGTTASVIFTATMRSKTGGSGPGPGGVTTADDIGLWATDHNGTLRLLLREGQNLGGATVKNFTVLSAISGSAAQTRSFNNDGGIIVRVTDSANGKHILHIQMPRFFFDK